jgi:hypothetical protein
MSIKKLFLDEPFPVKDNDSLKSSALTLIHMLSPLSTSIF